jgi:hypothetical protein
MKEEVILRILAQESPKSSCGCKDMMKRSYRDLFAISGKWLGVYLELFLKTRGLLQNLWTVG